MYKISFIVSCLFISLMVQTAAQSSEEMEQRDLQQRFIDFASQTPVKLWFDDIGGRYDWSSGVSVPRRSYPEPTRFRLDRSYVTLDLYRLPNEKKRFCFLNDDKTHFCFLNPAAKMCVYDDAERDDLNLKHMHRPSTVLNDLVNLSSGYPVKMVPMHKDAAWGNYEMKFDWEKRQYV